MTIGRHDDVEEIKRAEPNPLVFVGLLGWEPLRGSRPTDVIILCPVHDERTPSFHVTKPQTLRGHCFGCGVTLDSLGMLAVKHGLDARRDFRRVVEIAAQLFGVDIRGGEPRRTRRVDPVVDDAERLDRLAEDFIVGRFKACSSDAQALDRAGFDRICVALDTLAAADDLAAEEHARRDQELDKMADDVLAQIARREGSWLTP